MKGQKNNVYIGVSHTLDGLSSVSEGYEQAAAAQFMSMLEKTGCTRYADIGVMKLVFGIKNTNILREFVRENLGTLRRFDVERNADYCDTLKLYLTYNGSVSEAAEKAGVHRHSLSSALQWSSLSAAEICRSSSHC